MSKFNDPYQIESINAEVKQAILKSKKSAKGYFSEKPESDEIKSFGISGSTFRAYRNFDPPPSQLYRSWSAEEMERLNKFTISDPSREGFLKLHREMSDRLNSSKKSKALTPAQHFKLIDLFVKFSSRYCENQNLKNFLVSYGNIPLDKFSLQLVGELFYGVVISQNPSMGHISNENTYHLLQKRIYSFTSEIGIPNLYFDHFAWNSRA